MGGVTLHYISIFYKTVHYLALPLCFSSLSVQCRVLRIQLCKLRALIRGTPLSTQGLMTLPAVYRVVLTPDMLLFFNKLWTVYTVVDF